MMQQRLLFIGLLTALELAACSGSESNDESGGDAGSGDATVTPSDEAAVGADANATDGATGSDGTAGNDGATGTDATTLDDGASSDGAASDGASSDGAPDGGPSDAGSDAPPVDTTFATSIGTPGDVAVSSDGSWIVWASKLADAGTQVERWSAAGGVVKLADGDGTDEVEIAAGTTFWNTKGGLRRAPVDPAPAATIVPWDEGATTQLGIASGYILFVRAGINVRWLPYAFQSDAGILPTFYDKDISALAVEGTKVDWTAPIDGGVKQSYWTLDPSGSTPASGLYASGTPPTVMAWAGAKLAAGHGSVLDVRNGSNGSVSTSVALPGTVTRLATAADGHNVYAATTAGVVRADLAPMTPTVTTITAESSRGVAAITVGTSSCVVFTTEAAKKVRRH